MPVSVVILPTHISSVTRMQTRKISIEKIPVRIRNVSVGRRSSFCVSVLRDCFGMNQMISRTSKGKMIPAATIKLGVAVQSLKKQMINPMMPKAQTATVPEPTPMTRPS